MRSSETYLCLNEDITHCRPYDLITEGDSYEAFQAALETLRANVSGVVIKLEGKKFAPPTAQKKEMEMPKSFWSDLIKEIEAVCDILERLPKEDLLADESTDIEGVTEALLERYAKKSETRKGMHDYLKRQLPLALKIAFQAVKTLRESGQPIIEKHQVTLPKLNMGLEAFTEEQCTKFMRDENIKRIPINQRHFWVMALFNQTLPLITQKILEANLKSVQGTWEQAERHEAHEEFITQKTGTVDKAYLAKGLSFKGIQITEDEWKLTLGSNLRKEHTYTKRTVEIDEIKWQNRVD